MLFLDDLPLQLGAYYPVGTNNIVLNRTLVDAVEAANKSKQATNALIYNLLCMSICMRLAKCQSAKSGI